MLNNFSFLAIGNAVATLTDPEKRKQYDLFGGDEEKFRHSHSHESYSTRTFECKSYFY
jgi:DnaJ family protein B protein 12